MQIQTEHTIYVFANPILIKMIELLQLEMHSLIAMQIKCKSHQK